METGWLFLYSDLQKTQRLTATTVCSTYSTPRDDLFFFLFLDDIYYAQRLMSATVNLISQDDCKNKYYDSTRVTDNMVCAGDPLWETDACKVKFFLMLFL